MPNIMAVDAAAHVKPNHPPIPAATARPRAVGQYCPNQRATTYPLSGMINAMFKQLAPIAVTPPSPNSNAWMTTLMLMASAAPHGPTASATSTPPIACPVVPPGSGRLNIMITNVNAAPNARSGTRRAARRPLTRRAATLQSGMQPA